jgi:hypothetical protein
LTAAAAGAAAKPTATMEITITAAKKTALAFVRVFVSFVIVLCVVCIATPLLYPRLTRPIVVDQHCFEGAAGLDADYSQFGIAFGWIGVLQTYL